MENGARIGAYGFKSLVLGDLIVRGIFSATFLFQCIPVATSVSQLPTKQQRSAYKSLQSATLSIVFGNCATIAFDVVYGIIEVDGLDTPPYLHAVLFALSNLPLRIGYSVLYMSILRLIEDRHKSVAVEIVVPPQRLNTDVDIVVEQHQRVRHEPVKIPSQILLNAMSNIFTPALIILAIASSATFVQLYINMYDPRQTNVGSGFIPSRPSLDSYIGRSAALAIAFYVVWGVAAMHLVLYASLLRSSLLNANIQDQAANTLASTAAPLFAASALTSIINFIILSPAGPRGSASRIITTSATYVRVQVALVFVVATGILTSFLINALILILPGRGTVSKFERWKMRWVAKHARGGDAEPKPTQDTLIYNA